MAYEIFGNNLTELHTDDVKVDDQKNSKQSNDRIEGRNAVIEAIKAGRTIDKLYIQDGLKDGTISSILGKLKGTGTAISFVKKQRLDSMSETGHHQGVIAQTTSYEYAEIDDIFDLAKKKGEPPFIILLDEIEDPHILALLLEPLIYAALMELLFQSIELQDLPQQLLELLLVQLTLHQL